MRRNILILAMSIFSIFVYSQHDIKLTKIPIEKMWMFKSGESYNEVLRKIKAEYPYNLLVEENDLMKVYDVKFAGMKFDVVNLRFHRSTGLWSVDFVLSLDKKDRDIAGEYYWHLAENLYAKYGAPDSLKVELNDKLDIWTDEKNFKVLLAFSLSESKGGKERWYINLDYYNYNYYKKVQQSNMDDL